MNHTAFQACISILGIVINLCSGAPEFCLTVVSETAEKCFLTGGSQAVNVITCDHTITFVITRVIPTLLNIPTPNTVVDQPSAMENWRYERFVDC